MVKHMYLFSFWEGYGAVQLAKKKVGDDAKLLFQRGKGIGRTTPVALCSHVLIALMCAGVEKYKKSLSLYPGDSFAFNNYATALHNLGEFSFVFRLFLLLYCTNVC
jgi:hypothetical protein